MNRFGRPDLIGDGSVHVLAFDAIRERSGRRWETRQDAVREYVVRQFDSIFADEGALEPLDDVNFLLAQSAKGFGAQSKALRLLSRVLEHFLGSSERSDVKIFQVTGIGPAGIETVPVDVTDAQLKQEAAIDDESQDVPLRERSPAMADSSLDQGSPLSEPIHTRRFQNSRPLVGDRTYEALFLVDPVWSIHQRAVASYVLRPLIFERQAEGLVEADLEKASPSDLIKLDLVILAEARSLFKQSGNDRHFVLHVPIHSSSVSNMSGRQKVLASLDGFHPSASTSVIVVLRGLNGGAPQSLLLELTSLLKGRCRAVIAQVAELDPRIARWRDAKLSGIAVDLSAVAKRGAHPTVKTLSKFALQIKGVAPVLAGYSVPGSPELLAAWAAGFTHVSGDSIICGGSSDLVSRRVEPTDLYLHH